MEPRKLTVIGTEANKLTVGTKNLDIWSANF